MIPRQSWQYLYALVEVEPKLIKFKRAKNVTKLNLRLTAKYHAHLQALTKTPAKFQKDLVKTIGTVAFTRNPKPKCFKPKND